jgi:hypothetical protein
VKDLVAVSFGAGLNSTALLWIMYERGIRPDVVLFADTGGEMPRTYDHAHAVQEWAGMVGWRFEWISRTEYHGAKWEGVDGKKAETLEEECLQRGEMPSIAYGSAGCSGNWKRRPMDRFLKQWPEAIRAWENGAKVQRWIGIDADEAHRSAHLVPDRRFSYHRPLVDWDIGRPECHQAVERSPFGVVGKSACFFCPATKKGAILALREEHPELLERALAIEGASQEYNHTAKGLGRRWSWAQFLAAEDAQSKLPFMDFQDPPSMPCGCADDSEDDD